MKKFIKKTLQSHRFLLFIFLFAYVQSIYIRIAIRQQINIYIFTPEAAFATLTGVGILFLIILFFIRKWQKTNIFNILTLLKVFCCSLLGFVILMQFTGFVIAFAFDKIELNFNRHNFTLSTLSDFLNGIIYGSFFLTYYYYQNNKKHQQKLALYNEALAESKIKQLKAQLNPHFLFNNLNILDQLIHEDKQKASDFLNEFAEIYRYVLHSTDKELVNIDEEIVFARQYFKLFQHKYGNTYQLNIENKNKNGFIVPLTLQLLIENAVQHNLGTIENPVCIQIEIDKNISVANNINLKRNKKPTSGRALKNLKEQYKLLSERPIEIHQNDTEFSLHIPIIHKTAK